MTRMFFFRKYRVTGNYAHGDFLIAFKSKLNPYAFSIDTGQEVCFINLGVLGVTFKLAVVYLSQSFNRTQIQTLYNIRSGQNWNTDRY